MLKKVKEGEHRCLFYNFLSFDDLHFSFDEKVPYARITSKSTVLLLLAFCLVERIGTLY